MADSFDPLEYLTHLRRNGKFAAIAIGSAMILTAAVSMLLPKQYTATATLVIEPPFANDPRAATSVSPVYLESLKTYEQFAGSDTLFAKACAKFELSGAVGEPCSESLKRRVLRVAKLKDTKVLKIGVTLPDARRAQQLAEYLATETVALNRSLARDSDRDTLGDVQTQLNAAAQELSKARADYDAATAGGKDRLLDDEVRTLGELRSRTSVEVLRSRAALAELASRKDTVEASVEQARLNSLTAEVASLDRQLTAQSAALSAARAKQERAAEALKVAQERHEAWSRRSNEAAIASGLRTEQLRVVDPSVVPQQPSFPNPPLFTGIAALIGSLLVLAYLSLRYGIERQRLQKEVREQLDGISQDYKAVRGGHR
jgi:polysaccharide biosynthesis transport protein